MDKQMLAKDTGAVPLTRSRENALEAGTRRYGQRRARSAHHDNGPKASVPD